MSPNDPARHDEWLFSECQETGHKISGLVSLDVQLIGFGLTLLTAAATVAASKGLAELLVGLPVVYAALLCFVFSIHGETMALAGYKAALEEHLTSSVGPVTFWESKVSPSVRRPENDLSILIALAVLAIFLVGASVIAGIEARHFGGKGWRERHPDLIFGLTLLAIGVGGVAVAASYWFGAAKRFDRSKNRTMEVLSEAAKPETAQASA